ncbi:MAG TPA: peptidoglycan DD-metalloendopeptidase family protein [Nitrospira sp.]|nr:peptidoglycan DD-metalloendopeptidase family protein [Rhodocyclaceae bacterium]HNO35749.1 peptidoglycan DD-metalloendopeptidase family protein [Nitrospira sp.]
MLREKTGILAHLKLLRDGDRKALLKSMALGAGVFTGMAAALAVAPGQDAPPPAETIVTQLERPAFDISGRDEHPFIREDRVLAGETLGALLKRLGVSDTSLTAHAGSPALMRDLGTAFRPGMVVTVATTTDGRLQSASFLRPGNDDQVVLTAENGQLVIRKQALELDRRIHMQSGTIQSSLFAATDAAGLPDSIAEELARMFGSEIDFHSDLRKGDRFSVIYEVFYHHGQAIRTGRILAAEFFNQGVKHSAYLFRHADGKTEYYGPDGRSLRAGFLRSPLEFSRVTSGFSMRLHPILGTWREHKGVDYGAPTGTAVHATADGIVDFAGWQNGYGNFVVLRHQDRYSTAYGHLSAVARGLRKGDRVSQNTVIGYVGSTGWATGPHLHYEFRINEIHQDPLKVSLPAAQPLDRQKLGTFLHDVAQLNAQLTAARQITTARFD